MMPWPTLIPHAWATTPWAASAVSLLLLTSAILDLVFARRYAGGRHDKDRGTSRLLIVSLSSNLALGLTLSALGIGRLPGDPVWLGVLGSLVGACGLWLRYAAIVTLGRLFTWRVDILADHRLVETGVFRYVRHPSYTGGILAVLGCFLALGDGLAILVFCLTHVPLLLYRVHIEEAVLTTHFGDAYRAYADRTWRLFPLID